jgi:hypothetical protein
MIIKKQKLFLNVIEYWNKFKNEDTPITNIILILKWLEQIDYIIKKFRSGTFWGCFSSE